MRILVSAESFGYGPITTCLCVMKEIKKHHDIVLDFIGSGISMEQAKLSNLFDKYYLCDTYNMKALERNKEIFLKYKYFISSENVNGAIFAQRYIKNVYYMDNLVWMWDEIPKELGNVKKFFISETFSCKDNFARVGSVIKNPIFVGPIRDMKALDKFNIKNQLIINIGGASSFLFNQDIINEFYNKIINYILCPTLIDKFEKIIVCGGSNAINGLHIKSNKKIFVKTLSNDEYIKEMNQSSHCIMSSGLGNFIETLNKNKNIMYLPAVNYSQLLQLQYYEKMNFGFDILNWNDFDFYKEIPLFLEESVGVDMVVENVKKFNAGDYKEKIEQRVINYLNNDQKDFFEIRNNNYDSYDKNAAFNIVNEIIKDIKEVK